MLGAFSVFSVLCSVGFLCIVFFVEGLIYSAPWGVCITGGIGYLLSALPPPERLLGASLGMCSLPGDLHGVLDRSVPSALIWEGCFCRPLRRTVASIAARLLGASLTYPVL